MRYICVHGHFYQPPRENPSLEAVELQDSAYPYHDWNERVCAECYAPNGSSRILNDKQEITEIVNNYALMSFNFGPTLLSWIEAQAPKVYEKILEADKQSRERFGGHGNAIAQAYNHMILPLSNRRDKETQVKWGIADFEHRFQRKPEGMWLPETAVNTETLEVLADHGIAFTILAPRQAKRVRRRDGRKWVDVTGDRIDPSRAYQVRLPSRKRINVFFYDGPISQGVAFEGLLDNGQRFADRLRSGFSDARTWPQLVHIATDGESYGHHHHFGEMALSFALRDIEKGSQAQLINYGHFLEKFPADHFVEIVEDSSWSCMHGIERWRSNCGCNSGGHGWNQEWRAPLRASLDWLRDTLVPIYEERVNSLLKDPWAARDAYIRVILDRSDESLAAFFGQHATHELSEADRVTAMKLLEIQRQALLMYTSCGWFFDELSGIETVQVIHYAGRAARLADEVTGQSIEPEFLKHLSTAKSNLAEHGDGAQIYEKWIKPAYVNTAKMAGHYAVSSLFENYESRAQIYCYRVDREKFAMEAEGKLRLATGRAKFSSDITRETSEFNFAALHLGDHNLLAGVNASDGDSEETVRKTLSELFARADTAEMIRYLDGHFSEHTLSLKSLFRDAQRKITKLILNESLNSTAAAYRGIYESNASLIRFLQGIDYPIPPSLYAAAEIALNNQLREALERAEPDADAIRSLFREAGNSRVKIDETTLEFTIRKRLEREAQQFAEHPETPENIHRFKKWIDLALGLPFSVALWQAQNVAYAPLLRAMEAYREPDTTGDAARAETIKELFAIKDALKIHGVWAAHAAAT